MRKEKEMCVENASIDTRRKVLKKVHEVAVKRAAGDIFGDGRGELHSLVERWVDELAKAHQPNSCKQCGHKF